MIAPCLTWDEKSGEGERDAPAAGHPMDLLYTTLPPPLRIRPAFGLDDVQQEVNHRRGCDRAPMPKASATTSSRKSLPERKIFTSG